MVESGQLDFFLITYLLLLLAFSLFFSRVRNGDVQRSFQRRQVIAAERCLTSKVTDAFQNTSNHLDSTVLLDPRTPQTDTFNSMWSSSIFWGKNVETSPSACERKRKVNKTQWGFIWNKLGNIRNYRMCYLLGEFQTEVIHLHSKDHMTWGYFYVLVNYMWLSTHGGVHWDTSSCGVWPADTSPSLAARCS